MWTALVFSWSQCSSRKREWARSIGFSSLRRGTPLLVMGVFVGGVRLSALCRLVFFGGGGGGVCCGLLLRAQGSAVAVPAGVPFCVFFWTASGET